MNSFFGNYLYDRLIPEDHFLRRVSQVIDFSFVDELCEELYHQQGAGRNPLCPSQLFKMLFLGFVYHISDRDLEEQINDRISFKWFLGLSAEEAAPDHSSLTVFRERLGEENFRGIFNKIVQTAKEKGLKDEKLKMVDATHLEANANRHKAYEKKDDNDPTDSMHKYSSDPDARVGYKTKDKPFYGYKSHEIIDTKVGIIEDVIVSPGNESDTPYFPELIKNLEPQTAVTADQAYETAYHEFLCKQKNLIPYLAIKSNRKDPFKQREKENPKYQAALKIRSLYERTFGEAKQWHGLRRCRWRGLAKTTVQCLLTATVQNIKRIVTYAKGPPRLHPLYLEFFNSN